MAWHGMGRSSTPIPLHATLQYRPIQANSTLHMHACSCTGSCLCVPNLPRIFLLGKRGSIGVVCKRRTLTHRCRIMATDGTTAGHAHRTGLQEKNLDLPHVQWLARFPRDHSPGRRRPLLCGCACICRLATEPETTSCCCCCCMQFPVKVSKIYMQGDVSF